MDQPTPAVSLLEELDRRQDEVLAELDLLEARIKQLLNEYAGDRPTPTKHPLALLETERDAA